MNLVVKPVAVKHINPPGGALAPAGNNPQGAQGQNIPAGIWVLPGVFPGAGMPQAMPMSQTSEELENAWFEAIATKKGFIRYVEQVESQLAETRNQLAATQGHLVGTHNQLLATHGQLVATHGQLVGTHNQFIATQGQLAATQGQLVLKTQQDQNTQVQLGQRNVQIAAAQAQLESWRTEYNGFASVVGPLAGMTGGLISVYGALNSTSVAFGVSLLSGLLRGYEMEVVSLMVFLAAYRMTSLVGPAVVYPVLKLGNLIKDLLVAILKFCGNGLETCRKGLFTALYTILKTTINASIWMIKKIWEYQTPLLALVFVSLFAYYNPTANGIVTPFLKQASVYLSLAQDWGMDTALPLAQAAWANPEAYYCPKSLLQLIKLGTYLKALVA